MEKVTAIKLHLLVTVFLVIAVLIAGYVLLALDVALPRINPVTPQTTSLVVAPAITLPWPSYGQAAVGLNDNGVIATNGLQKPAPTASTAKLITALCVLQKYPLSVNQSGPEITITPADVAIYNSYQAEDGSDMLVTAGEQLSEYQMLQAMLLPSADNIADTLAIWAFGSLGNYSSYANQFVRNNGLDDTHVGIDASGFDPSTTSTASDLVKLGELSMKSSVIASIVAQPSAGGFPLVGSIHNINSVLGQDSIIGVKTGNTNQAGGVFVSASRVLVNNQEVVVYTALMQAPSLFDAIYGSLPLIVAAQSNFGTPPAIVGTAHGSVVGQYVVPWNHQVINAIAAQPVLIRSWGGDKINESINLRSINVSYTANQVVGSITASASLLKYSNTSDILLSQAPTKPSNWWRIFHPESLIHI